MRTYELESGALLVVASAIGTSLFGRMIESSDWFGCLQRVLKQSVNNICKMKACQYNVFCPNFKKSLGRLAGVKAHLKGLVIINIHYLYYSFLTTYLNTSVSTLTQMSPTFKLVSTPTILTIYQSISALQKLHRSGSPTIMIHKYVPRNKMKIKYIFK